MGDGTNDYRYDGVYKVTVAQVRKSYVPIKAFLTRSGLQCTLVVPQ